MIICTMKIAIHFLARDPVMSDCPAVAAPLYLFYAGWVWDRLAFYRRNEVSGGVVSASVATGVVGPLSWGGGPAEVGFLQVAECC